MEGNKICLYCQRALGCPLLFGKDGRFDADRLITEANPKECDKYVDIVGARERSVRERMYKNFGLGYMRALHELPELVMEGLRQGEKDELMYENVPNFQDPKLLWEGITSIEREDVLRHQTDESGQIIVEVDSESVEHKLARPEYHIKAYMCDPDGPIKADKAVTWVWNINQVVDHILKTEAEQGLIVKVKKPSPAAAEPEAEQPKEEGRETNMAAAPAGRTVRTVRTTTGNGATGPAKPAPAATKPVAATPASAAPGRRAQPKPVAAAPAAAKPATPARAPAPAAAAAPGGGKVASPPTRRVATPTGAPGRPAAAPGRPAAAAAPAQAAAAEAPAGLSQDELEAAIFKVVNPMFEEILNAVKAGQQTTIDCATILGDIAGQTGGKFQIPMVDQEGNYVVREDGSAVMETPQLWTHPSKIFAHVEGTGFNPENLQAVDYAVEEVAEGTEEVVEEQPEGEA